METIEADYVVVGAGSAGCVVAARLSEDPSVRVVVLEAGGKDSNIWIHVPIGYGNTPAQAIRDAMLMLDHPDKWTHVPSLHNSKR